MTPPRPLHARAATRRCLLGALLAGSLLQGGCVVAAATGAVVGAAVSVTGAVVGTTIDVGVAAGKAVAGALSDDDGDRKPAPTPAAKEPARPAASGGEAPAPE